jgi:hypothetical protein
MLSIISSGNRGCCTFTMPIREPPLIRSLTEETTAEQTWNDWQAGRCINSNNRRSSAAVLLSMCMILIYLSTERFSVWIRRIQAFTWFLILCVLVSDKLSYWCKQRPFPSGNCTRLQGIYTPSVLTLKTLIYEGTNGMKPLVTEFVT